MRIVAKRTPCATGSGIYLKLESGERKVVHWNESTQMKIFAVCTVVPNESTIEDIMYYISMIRGDKNRNLQIDWKNWKKFFTKYDLRKIEKKFPAMSITVYNAAELSDEPAHCKNFDIDKLWREWHRKAQNERYQKKIKGEL